MPKPTPHAVQWLPTPRWPEADSFWSETIGPDELASISAKYSSLLDLIAAAPGAGRDRGLRALAAAWPGALREGQLASATLLAARRASVAGEILGPRGAWRSAGMAAVPLWAELHRLLGDVARIRAERRGPGELPGALGSPADLRWPSAPLWWARLRWPIDARLPRAWLAAVAGYDPAELDRVLRT